MLQQLQDINPSAKAPLLRRLMSDEDLAYLREGKTIVGFELDLEQAQKMSGFTLVGIQKHTIYAYRSDLHEPARLVLFPPLDKLFDDTFAMLDLDGIKTEFKDTSFHGKVSARGKFANLVQNLTPPENEVDIPQGVSDKMVEQMKMIQENYKASEIPLTRIPKPSAEEHAQASIVMPDPVEEEVIGNEDGMALNDFDNMDDNYGQFDEGGFDENSFDGAGFDSYEAPQAEDVVVEEPEPEPEPEPEIEEDPRALELKAQDFENLVDVGDYVYMKFNVPKAVTTQVVNKALQSDVVAKGQVTSIALAVMLFAKLLNEKKI